MAELTTTVIAAQRGDIEAFGEIVRRFQDMAFAVACVRLRDARLAEDVAQEAFIEAYLCIGTLHEPRAFASWFRRILLRQCNRMTRRGRIMTESLEPAMMVATDAPGPYEIAESKEVGEIVQAAIDTLPEHERVATMLFYMSDYSQQDIAAFLGVPLTTVKKRLQYARKRLKERIEVMNEDYARHRPSRNDSFSAAVRLFIAVRTADAGAVRAILAENPGIIHEQEPLDDTLSHLYPRARPRDIRRRADDDAKRKGWTPLHWAVWSGNADVVKLLLGAGADPDAGDGGGDPPIIIAARYGYLGLLELLLRHGADIGGAGCRYSPLHVAVSTARRSVAELLLNRGIDVDMADFNGRTPLHWAAIIGHEEMSDLLRSHGADIERKDLAGRSPQWWGAHGGHSSMTGRGPIERDDATSRSTEIFETGIKALDLLVPIPRGGTLRWTAPWMVGAMVLQLEIINTVTARHGGRTILIALESRPRELEDLQLMLREAGLQESVEMSIIPAGASAEIRHEAVMAGLALARRLSLEDEGELLLIVDHMALDDETAALIARPPGAGSPVIMTMITSLAQDEGGDGPALVDIDADVHIVFTEDLARRGLYPAIDPFLSTSKLLYDQAVGSDHLRLARRAREILRSLDRSSDAPPETIDRARRLQRFLTQPFFVAQIHTAIPGEYVPLEDTLRSIEALTSGEYDDLPEEAFSYIGSIEQASAGATERRVE